MSTSELMITLHRYHRQLTELRHRLTKGEQLIQYNKGRLDVARDECDKKIDEMTRMRLAVKEGETELKSYEEALRKRRIQLSEAKTNKEHQALKDQIEADEKTGSSLADDVLAAMEEADEFSQQVEEARSAVKRLEDLIAKMQREYDEERPAIEADIIKYTERLAIEEKESSFSFEEPYHRLVRKLGGEQALAPVSNGNYCGHCNTLIPIHFIADICNGHPFTCQVCGRLLYIAEGFVIE